jgi:hypothetical protein
MEVTKMKFKLQEIEKFGKKYIVEVEESKAFVFDYSGILLSVLYAVFNTAEEAVEEYLSGGSNEQ